MKYLGSHVGLSSPDYFLGSVNEALSYGATALMLYTGAPQNTLRKDIAELRIEEGKAKWLSSGNSLDQVVIHAPYIINLANRTKPEAFAFAKDFLKEELRRCAAFGAKWLVLHPGAHVGQGDEEGLSALIEGLTEVLSEDGTDVTIALETMAGKGSEIGRTFEFYRDFFERFPLKHRVGVCLDTCHVHDAGYDLGDPEGLLDEFDRLIGLDRLKVVHLNDSKNVRGARKDRHANLGKGEIGFEKLCRFAHLSRLDEIPIILETPWIDGKPPYKEEIAALRKGELIG